MQFPRLNIYPALCLYDLRAVDRSDSCQNAPHKGIDDFIHLMYRVSGLAAAIGVFSGLRLTTVTGAYNVRSI